MRWCGLVVLGGCSYSLVPESRICEDVAFAISERTMVCSSDPDLSNARYAAFMDEAECLLPDEVTDPYNPEGILPTGDNPEERERLERAYDCVRAIRGAGCDRVERRGDELGWWLTLDAGCDEVATIEGSAGAGVGSW